MHIREAVEADFDEITAIYNEVLTTSTAIYNDRPAKSEERIAWWRSRTEQGYPVLVAANDNSVAGFEHLEISGHGPAIASQLRELCTFIPECAARELEPNCLRPWSRKRKRSANTR